MNEPSARIALTVRPWFWFAGGHGYFQGASDAPAEQPAPATAPEATTAPNEWSIAVLPFVNMSPDKDILTLVGDLRPHADDISAVRDENAGAVVNALHRPLTGTALAASSKPQDPEAYNLTLQGRYFFGRRVVVQS